MKPGHDECEHTLRVLEYEQLLQLIASYTQTEIGRSLIMQLRPLADARQIKQRHPLYQDGIMLQAELNLKSPAFAVRDLGPLLRRVAPTAAVLDGEDLLLVRQHLQTVATVTDFMMRAECHALTALTSLTNTLQPLKAVTQRLEQSLDDDGALTDGASPELRRLRRRIRQLEERIKEHLNRLLKGRELEDALQEKFVTVRNGRFVIPVKRTEMAAVDGIIHDYSGSGQTVFLEPVSALPLENDWATARMEEQDECLRILAELSASIRDNLAGLRHNQEVLAEFDAILAVANWAVDYSCSLPTFGKELQLRGARHPLLQQQYRRQGGEKKVVPLTFVMKPSHFAMVITGSNTGGKTVALKTVGLLTLMAQAGLPVPVENGSIFRVFHSWFADIGDEQSIAANLSTFSAHMAHVHKILQEVIPEQSLVLLDELGTGTDPLEGAALACAILQQFVSQSVLTMATTHLGVVKTYVHNHERMINAAVRFNTETLQPEYALDIGRPGASHALIIAQRLGLPQEILDVANQMLSSEHLQLENMLAKMEEDQRLISQREQQLQAASSEITQNRDQLKTELEQFRRQRKRLLNDAYRQAAGIIENTRRQMESLLKNTQPDAAVDRLTIKKAARKQLQDKQKTIAGAIRDTKPQPVVPVPADDLAPGRRVWIESLQTNAEIIAVSRDQKKVEVQVGNLKFTVPCKDLGQAKARKHETENAVVKISRPRPRGRVETELNLIGLRSDEAAEKIDQFLNQAVLANLQEVRIIHGFGTGRLQEAVHANLRHHKLVRSFRLGEYGKDPGGAGSTNVELA